MSDLFMAKKISFRITSACVCAAAFVSCAAVPPASISAPEPKQFPYMVFVKGGVPVVGNEQELNSLIRTRAVERYAEFEDAAKRVGKRIDADADALENQDNVKELCFNISWKAGRSDWDYISIIITATWLMDEDYCKSGSDAFTWDVKQKTLLGINDILPFTGFDSLASLSRFTSDSLRQKLDPYNKDAAVQKIIERETAPLPENYSVFLLEKDSVTFYFNGTVFWGDEDASAEPQSVTIFKNQRAQSLSRSQ